MALTSLQPPFSFKPYISRVVGIGELNAGTTLVKYNPCLGKDQVVRAGTVENIDIKYQCISFMKEYEGKSLEELRLEDYRAGRVRKELAFGNFLYDFNTNKAPALNRKPPVKKTGAKHAYEVFSKRFETKLFRPRKRFGVGEQSSGTGLVKYSPYVGSENIENSGISRFINIKYNCITAMREYEDKSLEELRLEDYRAGRRLRTRYICFQTNVFVFGRKQNYAFSFRENEEIGNFNERDKGTTVTYSPIVESDNIIKYGSTQIINVKYNCITIMKEYENKSIEELRFEDYRAGRKPFPLRFHSVHGGNIKVTNNGTTAERINSHYDGVVFSSRPVRVNEVVYIRLVKMSKHWRTLSGINFGFTTDNPNGIAHSIPKFAAPTKNTWIIELNRNFCENGKILHFYVDTSGELHYGVNGQYQNHNSPRIDINRPLWAVIDVYGRCKNVQFVGPEAIDEAKRLEQVSDRPRTSLDQVTDRARTSLDQVTDRARTSLDQVTDRARTSLDQVSDRPRTSLDQVTDRARRSVDQVADRARTSLDQVTDRARTSLDQVTDRDRTSLDQVSDRARRSLDLVVNGARRPDPVVDGARCPDPIVDGARRPDLVVDGARCPDLVVDGARCPDPVVDGARCPDPIVDEARRPDIVLDGARCPDPIVDEARRPDTVVDGARRPDPIVDGTRCPDPIVDGTRRPDPVVDEARCPDTVVDRSRRLDTIVDGARRPDAIVDGARRSDQNEVENDPLVDQLSSLSVGERSAPKHKDPVPLYLHKTKGRNAHFTGRGIAERCTGYCQGYVFTARPFRPGKTIRVQILNTASYPGSLAIGLTSSNPTSLKPQELPDEAEFLQDRPEYWIVHADAANGLQIGDELDVTLTRDGKLVIIGNGSRTVFHVDHTLKLWAFFDIYGSTQEVKLSIFNEKLAENGRNLPSTPLRFECNVCLDKEINCVLYKCGHMCMCYDCAVHQWKNEGRSYGRCPICRAQILDVIRTYNP